MSVEFQCRRPFRGAAATALAILLTAVWTLGPPPLEADCPIPDPDFHEPPCIYRQPEVGAPGALEVDLDVRSTEVTVAGRRMRVATYSGTLPGPTLRLRRGDELAIRLSNNMDKLGVPATGMTPPGMLHTPAGFTGTSQDHQIYTNLHVHGLQVSPTDPGDNVLLFVQPGQWHDYRYKIADGKPLSRFDPPKGSVGKCLKRTGLGLPTPAHPTGLFWYHPHFHGSVTHQGWQGLSGALVIEGEIDEVPAVREARERLIVLNELWVADDGTVPTALVVPNAGWSPFTSLPSVPTDLLLTVNGVYQPEIEIREGETQRWRVLAAGPHRFFWLEVEGHELHQIAQDGIPFATARKVDRILLATGNRAEFIIRGGKEGRYAITALAYDQGHPGGGRPRRLLGTLVSKGRQEEPGELPVKLVPPFNPRLGEVAECYGEQNVIKRSLTFQGDVSTAPVRFTIDNREFPHLYLPAEGHGKLFATRATEWTNCDLCAPQCYETLPCPPGADPSSCDPEKGVRKVIDNPDVPKYCRGEARPAAGAEVPPCCLWSHQNPGVGRLEEWTLINQDVFQHPYHLHVNPFQVVDFSPPRFGDETWNYAKIYGKPPNDVWWDVFRLPAAHLRQEGETVPDWLERHVVSSPAAGGDLVPGWVKIRIYFRPDTPGLTVYHCHILPHEDNGMMGTVCMREDASSRCRPQLLPSCTKAPGGCAPEGGAQ